MFFIIEIFSYCLLLRMKLASVHRVLKFNQSGWLRKCFEFNTAKKNGANSSEKDFLVW